MLRIFNTASGKIEDVITLSKGKITLYVCGITPYDTTHLGHAFTYITFDTLVKYLTHKGYTVDYTQNVTDINDRNNDILQRAKEQNTSWENVAIFWTDRFLRDMDALHWTKPNHYLWASQQLSSMITLIQEIVASGYGYVVNGSVYLDVTKYSRYGSLSRLSKEKMLEKAREFEEDLNNTEKKYPLDITLWRATSINQPKHIPSFQSPFGSGRPGWHIECSAMSISSLGQQIDIHGGGIDLIYPHHESEITQSETATGKIPFVKHWIHVALVKKDNKKMSKSKGNLILISDLLEKYSPNAIRYVLLSHHYRTSWNFDEEELIRAEETIDKIKKSIGDFAVTNMSNSKSSIIAKFEKTMQDDLNIPKALEILCEATKNNPTINEKRAYITIARVLGFLF